MNEPKIVLKWPPGLMGATSQGIGSSSDTGMSSVDMVAKKMLVPEQKKTREINI